MKLENVSVNSLTPDPKNARSHEKGIPELIESLKAFGQQKNLVVWHDVVIAGNGLLEAARQLGWTKIAISRTPDEWTYEQAQAFALADNRTAELSTWDVPVLDEIRFDLDNSGWDTEKFGFDPLPVLMNFGDADPDDVPELPEVPRTKLGDLWALGEHRVLCGDAFNADDYKRLLKGAQIDLVLTDPPYGVAVEYGDDSPEDTPELVQRIADEVVVRLCELAPVVLLTPGNRNHLRYPNPTWTLAWAEKAGVGRSPWGFTCWQPILAYGADPYLKNGLGSRPDTFFGDGEGASSDQHPVAKPVKVWTWLLNRGSIRTGERVLDPFGGSGTTLVVCAQEQRVAYLMEIDPRYIDVIITRWENLTGKKAKLLR